MSELVKAKITIEFIVEDICNEELLEEMSLTEVVEDIYDEDGFGIFLDNGDIIKVEKINE